MGFPRGTLVTLAVRCRFAVVIMVDIGGKFFSLNEHHPSEMQEIMKWATLERSVYAFPEQFRFRISRLGKHSPDPPLKCLDALYRRGRTGRGVEGRAMWSAVRSPLRSATNSRVSVASSWVGLFSYLPGPYVWPPPHCVVPVPSGAARLSLVRRLLSFSTQLLVAHN